MNGKKIGIGLAIAVPTIAAVLLAVADLGCRIRTQRLNTQILYLVPAITLMVNEYTLHFQAEGSWPGPGAIYDDSVFPFLMSRSDNDERIDTYGTMLHDRRIEVTLHPDGQIAAHCVTLDN